MSRGYPDPIMSAGAQERAVVITALRPDQAARCLRVTGHAGWVLPLETGSVLVINDVGAAMGTASAASSLQRMRPGHGPLARQRLSGRLARRRTRHARR
jgi:hypothetical protein